MSRILYEIIPDSKDIDRELVLAAKYGTAFEYNDFMNPDQLDDKEYCRQKIVFYKNLGRNMSNDTLHGAFIDLVVQSTDSLIRDASRKRVYQSMEIAQELGVRGVVFHTGLIPNYRDESYMQCWRDGCVRFWRKVLDDFPEQSVYIENMFDMDASGMAALGEAMKDQERFGLCLDYAHAVIFGRGETLENWYQHTAPYVRHMHINDNNRKYDQHRPLGQGSIDWVRFGEILQNHMNPLSVLLEMTGWEAQEKSLEFIQDQGWFI